MKNFFLRLLKSTFRAVVNALLALTTIAATTFFLSFIEAEPPPSWFLTALLIVSFYYCTIQDEIRDLKKEIENVQKE